MKAFAHANNRSLTIALHNFFFIPDIIEFYVGTGRDMPWCSYAKPVLSSPESYSGICNYIFIGASLGDPKIINVPSAVCMSVAAMHLYVVPQNSNSRVVINIAIFVYNSTPHKW